MVAVAAAREMIAKQMTAAEGNKLIDAAIAEVDAKLH
ncbi:MAG: ATP F0F1 synthase subunit B, partial [Pseudomonadota bacterium]